MRRIPLTPREDGYARPTFAALRAVRFSAGLGLGWDALHVWWLPQMPLRHLRYSLRTGVCNLHASVRAFSSSCSISYVHSEH